MSYTRKRRWTLCAASILTLLAAGCGVEEREVRDGITQALKDSTFTQSHAYAGDVHAFYVRRDMRPAWTNGRGLNGRGRDALVVLESARSLGLDPARYDVEEARQLHERLDDAGSPQEIARLLATLDVHLTTGLRRYVGDVRDGSFVKHGPSEDDTASPLVTLLDSLANERHMDRRVAALEPSNSQYVNLRKALAHYTRIAEQGGWPRVESTDSVTTARTLEERLIAEGDPREVELLGQNNGHEAALRHFQARHGIDTTGTLDSTTLAQLNTPAAKRVESLSLNLDRLRALPRDSAGLRIVVNVPAYRMVMLENDAPILSMPVIVGKPEHQTPVILDTVRYIVANPYWNVPQSIFEEEILPAVRANPGYLESKNMEVVARDGDGVIDSGSIDWDNVDAESVPWMIRQRPGPWNALGKVKFLFPNRQAVYLHDTPEDHLFERTVRALSHGCVRLERPLELARIVVERRTELSWSDFEALLERSSEKHVPLTEGIPVAIVYQTAWIGTEGEAMFLRDVYGRDSR